MTWLIIRILCLALIVLAIALNIRKRGWRSYAINLLIAIDQVSNAVCGGTPDETISSRCARGQGYWYWKILGRILDAIQPGHCSAALRNEQERAHLPAELR
jgi:hypothetical protein